MYVYLNCIEFCFISFLYLINALINPILSNLPGSACSVLQEFLRALFEEVPKFLSELQFHFQNPKFIKLKFLQQITFIFM